MSISSHADILSAVLARLKAMSIPGIPSTEIYACHFPFDRAPAVGLACSEIQESEGPGTNERDDFMYGVMLTRVFGSRGHGYYHSDQYNWRQKVRAELHRQLIGSVENEIITKVRPSTLIIPRAWNNWGIDASVMEVWTWVRESRL